MGVRDPRLVLLEEATFACAGSNEQMGTNKELSLLEHSVTEVPDEICKNGKQSVVKYIIQVRSCSELTEAITSHGPFRCTLTLSTHTVAEHT